MRYHACGMVQKMINGKKEIAETGALIIASGNLDIGRTANEEIPYFLPMYPLDGMSVIKREIYTLRKAGISQIIVLCGYQKELLKNHLSHNSVLFCEDEKYEEHSERESLKTGLQFAKNYCSEVIVIPVECPAFRTDTIEKLREAGESAAACFEGKTGRICLFSTEGFENPAQNFALKKVETDDEGVLFSLTDEGGISRTEEYVKQKREAHSLFVKTKLVIGKEDTFFGPGVYELLTRIEESGSIQAAASQMKMSYSKCWKMLNKVEEEMGFPFLERYNGGKHGGRSKLTQEGKVFMERYHAMNEDLKRISRSFFDIYFRDFQ